MLPSLDGRRFAPLEQTDGEAGTETIFEYHEVDDLVWARYAGGTIRLGFLVGTREGDRLNFRYSHVNRAGDTANGACSSTIAEDDAGRLVLAEVWAWESKQGRGTSILRELA